MMLPETPSFLGGVLDKEGESLRLRIYRTLESKLSPEEVNKVKEAIELGISLHKDQKPRSDGPYPNHLLRVTDCIVSEFGILDPDVLKAAPLHDSVEDRSKKIPQELSYSGEPLLSDRENALDSLGARFGEVVAGIVRACTEEGSGEPEDNVLPMLDSEYLASYEEELREAIRDEKVLYIKLADFMDNALKISNVSDIKTKLWLATKYLPAFKMFIERLSKPDISMDEEKKARIVERLREGERIAQEIKEQAPSTDYLGYL